MPPPGLRRPGRSWQLHQALYGTRPASRFWQVCVGDVFGESQPPLARITPCPGAFCNETLDIALGVRGGGSVALGILAKLGVLDALLEEHIEIEKPGRVGLGATGGSRGRLFKRRIEWRGAPSLRFVWRADDSH
eukprot:9081719-Pyramimonas_sp.AAC.1